MEIIAGLKRVIITGGSGGLGQAIALVFADNDWEVMPLGRSDLDLTDREEVARFFEANPCDLLVCCAGIIRDVPLTRMNVDDWDSVFTLNFKAAGLCARLSVSSMLAKKRGHVVFVSSYAALHPAVGQAAYATAKAALHGLAQEMAAKYGDINLRFNVVLPGFLETPLTSVVTDKRKKIIRAAHCLKHFNTPEVVARFIWFLEEEMPFTSGQVFSLDSRL